MRGKWLLARNRARTVWAGSTKGRAQLSHRDHTLRMQGQQREVTAAAYHSLCVILLTTQ